MNPLLLVDSYKIHHTKMYPDNMTKLYSNLTPRKSRIKYIDHIVFFGLQHFIKAYLIDMFNDHFFSLNGERNDTVKKLIINQYKRHCPVDTAHIESLWDLGYLPIKIKALDEGSICPIGVPCLTITNTHDGFGWLVNYLETLMSCMLWQAITSATIAYEYKKILTKYSIETTNSKDMVQWQGHDFSMRGLSSIESAIISGMAHLAVGFTGTDTIPAIYQLETSYYAGGLIGGSVAATEHSVMCMGTKEAEINTFKRLIDLYPTGILSIVSDTWDLWTVLTKYLPILKNEILARDGKIVIRPDSGDPVDIICGAKFHPIEEDGNPARKGVIELLWDVFGGTVNEQGYKVLDSHIGAIYGDSITIDRAIQICEKLKAKGFASTNIVFGIGSYTYQYNTRDTFGFAVKATYGELTHRDKTLESNNNDIEPREIFKDPITDDGTKKSAKGLLRVEEVDGKLQLFQQQTWEQENTGLLTTVFENGELVKVTHLDDIRDKLKI